MTWAVLHNVWKSLKKVSFYNYIYVQNESICKIVKNQFLAWKFKWDIFGDFHTLLFNDSGKEHTVPKLNFWSKKSIYYWFQLFVYILTSPFGYLFTFVKYWLLLKLHFELFVYHFSCLFFSYCLFTISAVCLHFQLFVCL